MSTASRPSGRTDEPMPSWLAHYLKAVDTHLDETRDVLRTGASIGDMVHALVGLELAAEGLARTVRELWGQS